MSKNIGFLSWKPYVRPKSAIYTPKRDDEHLRDINEAVDKFSKILEAAAKKSLQPATEKNESSSTPTVASLVWQRLPKHTETFKAYIEQKASASS